MRSGLLVSLATLALLALPAAAQQAPRPEIAAGAKALEAGDLDAAERQFEELLEDDPDNVAAHLGMSRVLEERGLLMPALEATRRAERTAPDIAATSFAVGRLLARLGASRQALDALERARQLAPEDPEPAMLAALLLRDEGRVDEAAAVLADVWQRGSRPAALAELLGSLQLELGRSAQALDVAEALLVEDPDQASLLMIKGLALARDLERRAEAIAAIERAIGLGPPRPGQAWLELAILRLEGGDAVGALPALREAERLTPDNPEVFKRLAAALRASGDPAGARQALERFERLRAAANTAADAARRLDAELNAALALAGEDRLGEALGKLEKLASTAPQDARIHAARGKVLFSMSRVDEAIAAITRARELDPGRAEHHFLEGVFLLGAGRATEAEGAERRALELDPTLAQAHVMLAGSLAKQDRPQEAALHFARALELGADTPPLRLGYAAVLEELGRPAEAAEQMEAYGRLKN